MSYQFVDLWENFYEEILLDDYKYFDSNLIEEISVQGQKTLRVSPKSNWVNAFLDEKDVFVCTEDKERVLRILDI